MHEAHDFLIALTMVLCVAAVTTVLFQRLRQPVVLGYIIAGLIIGPYVPTGLVANAAVVRTLSELGVILLMFSLGLDFSLRKLVQIGPTAGVTAVIQCTLMIWLGFVVGRAFGWTTVESLYAGALIAISSTTIIAKAYDEQKIRGKLRELVVGILIVEDLIAILLMAILTAISMGAGLSAGALALTVGKLVAFLVGLVVVGLLIVPRAMRYVTRLHRAETTLVAAVGFCFAVALLALELGYSVALGAFLAGSLIAESGEERLVEHLVNPVKDIFAAIFFVSVGMMIDPALVARHWAPVVVLTLVVVVGKIFGVTAGAFLTGNGTRTSVQAGMSLAQIGEFSFIIAGLGLTLGATGAFLYPVAVTVSAVTTLSTPWLIRYSGATANWVDRKLPRPLQTFVSLYGTWIERLHTSPRKHAPATHVRRFVRLLIVDTSVLVALIIGTSVEMPDLVTLIEGETGLSVTLARVLIIAAACVIAGPFFIGIIRVSRGLGVALAERAIPASAAKVDFGAAPRRALVVTLQLASLLIVGVPLLAVTQPFLPGLQGAAVLLVLLVIFGIGFWRSAQNLQGHVRAGAEVIVNALAAQSRSTREAQLPEELAGVRALLPGIGEPTPFKLHPESPAVGKTLADLNLRGLTGATVLAIRRGDQGAVIPSANEVLRDGDILALAGTKEAIEAARVILCG